jgi:hypothetical protein
MVCRTAGVNEGELAKYMPVVSRINVGQVWLETAVATKKSSKLGRMLVPGKIHARWAIGCRLSFERPARHR